MAASPRSVRFLARWDSSEPLCFIGIGLRAQGIAAQRDVAAAPRATVSKPASSARTA